MSSFTQYRLSSRYPQHHLIEVEVHLNTVQYRDLVIEFANCRPGRYELANYAQNVIGLEATTENGLPVRCMKETKNRWRIYGEEAQEVQIHFQYYANQLDAGAAYVGDDLFYANFVNCLPRVLGRENDICSIKIDLPEGFTAASGLRKKEGLLVAHDYWELIDHQFVAAKSLAHHEWEVRGLRVHLWLYGSARALDHLLPSFSSFMAVQYDIFQSWNWEEYHFFFLILPYKIHHGVEHRNTTVIALGPEEDFGTISFHQELLGISSHEFFHAWNACRIRPKEFIPYPVEGETYFQTGYVLEGLTTYYGDLALARAGVFSPDLYFHELENIIKRHIENMGRFKASLTESSVDLWMDGYRAGTPGKKVSIYVKGCLVAFLLDTELRRRSDDRISLDEVMREMWRRFGSVDKGYAPHDFQALAEALAGQSLAVFFDSFISGKQPLEEPLEQAFAYYGIQLNWIPNPSYLERSFGIKIKKDQENGIKISTVHPQSRAYSVLAADDEIIQINSKESATGVETINVTNSPELSLQIRRGNRLEEIQLLPEQKMYYPEPTLVKQPTANEIQKRSYQNWLWQAF